MDTFPLCSFPPARRRPLLAGLTVESGPSIAGPGQTLDWSGGGWWVLELGGMSLRTPQQRKLWNAMMMRLRGGAVEVIVPFPFGELAPMPLGQSPGAILTTHSDGTTFSDGSQYSQPGLVFTLDGAVSDGDTTARLSRSVGADLTGGEIFTFVHADAGPRVYMVEGVYPVDGEPDLFDIEFGPPARGDVADGAAADFGDPRCVMRLISGAESWPQRQHRTPEPAQAVFVESFEYLTADYEPDV